MTSIRRGLLCQSVRLGLPACKRRDGRVLAAVPVTLKQAEANVLDAISGARGRGKDGIDDAQRALLEAAVQRLEAGGGVPEPTKREDLLDGRWQLLFTSRPGSASPIQRAFTGTEAFTIFQEVTLGQNQKSRVNNVVEFGLRGRVGTLRVEAEASTSTRQLPGFTPRKGAGIALFGKSQTGPPARCNMRVDFQFDRAAFNFRALPFNIPYPVPFKLLGDETKGWIDITYLNPEGTFRLTRGNKGTLFVLVKRESVVDSLLAAIRDKENARIKALINKLSGAASIPAPAKSATIVGKWRLLWTEQAADANSLQKALAGQVRNWQVIQSDGGQVTLENCVDLGLTKVRAIAQCTARSDTQSEVRLTDVFAETLGQRIPLGGKRDDVGYIDWAYIDDNIRITLGSKGSVFVHARE